MSAEIKLVKPASAYSDWYVSAMERLVGVVQELSHARDLDAVMDVVRRAARDLTGADGATFVLRDNDKCFYAEENAIAPLWKGQRFPLNTCVSGWTMLNSQPAIIEDIYVDPRIPIDAYRPTFVKSLVMVPIRKEAPVGAIGNYWAQRHVPTAEEVSILQALAHTTSVALANVDLYTQLQQKVKALEESNEELASFAWATSHDLKSPLRAIDNLSQWVEEDAEGGLPAKSKSHLVTLRGRVRRMERLLDDILDYSRIENKLSHMPPELVDGETLMQEVENLVSLPEAFSLRIDPAFRTMKLPRMPLQRVFSNLINNAAKHHDKPSGNVTVTAHEEANAYIFTVADDGPGVAADYREKIFEMFQTLKPRDKIEGSGMGLPIVRKLLAAHGCTVRVEPGTSRGAAFVFNWPKKPA
ncbi:MAG: GAF domain-containing sensor histidine kinase [Micavibrio sp.]|nr:GAF domain-containing sensor histidine kinase [Micavibrio sp.]